MNPLNHIWRVIDYVCPVSKPEPIPEQKAEDEPKQKDDNKISGWPNIPFGD